MGSPGLPGLPGPPGKPVSLHAELAVQEIPNFHERQIIFVLNAFRKHEI